MFLLLLLLLSLTPNLDAEMNENGKTLAILFETSYGTTMAKLDLSRRFADIIQYVATETSPTWITNFILYPFDSSSNKQEWNDMVYSINPKDIQDALNEIPNYQCPGGNTCENGTKCPRPILSVINDTLNNPNFQTGSIILLLTRSAVEDINMQSSVLTNIQRKQARVVIVMPNVLTPCDLPWTDPRSNALQTLAEVGKGTLSLQSCGVSQFLKEYLPSLYS